MGVGRRSIRRVTVMLARYLKGETLVFINLRYFCIDFILIFNVIEIYKSLNTLNCIIN
ncbi:hypothetical protein I3842_01G102200 [Carya illinoinensis]|uniref:Uncharacterized protein n=1 Tax=Carya illinoinensis TaxID=32201 RepID=A0A922G1Z5_CARIL|nr:hypothetical protein I3842_01G102200 [Carya illinoinensis]